MNAPVVVVVSSPGSDAAAHWSHAAAAALASSLATRGAAVRWLAVLRPGQSAPPAAAGVVVEPLAARAVPKLARVVADHRHLQVELAATAAMRAGPVRAVVHVGIGARGSPNVPWLADRLGVPAFAVARGAEVVCHRGDLVFADGSACDDFLGAERCHRCCRTGWLVRGNADDFRNRGDLLAGSLLAATAVFVPAAADRDLLLAFGVPERTLVVAADAAAIASRVLA